MCDNIFTPHFHLLLPISADSGKGPAPRYPPRVIPVSKSWLVLLYIEFYHHNSSEA